jgi:hypothetical protein
MPYTRITARGRPRFTRDGYAVTSRRAKVTDAAATATAMQLTATTSPWV